MAPVITTAGEDPFLNGEYAMRWIYAFRHGIDGAASQNKAMPSAKHAMAYDLVRSSVDFHYCPRFFIDFSLIFYWSSLHFIDFSLIFTRSTLRLIKHPGCESGPHRSVFC